MADATEERCARCGFSAEVSLTAPFEWEWYLMVERDLDLPAEGVTIPLCKSCLPRAGALQEAFFELGEFGDAEQAAIYEDAHDFLDHLDLRVLVGSGAVVRDPDRERST